MKRALDDLIYVKMLNECRVMTQVFKYLDCATYYVGGIHVFQKQCQYLRDWCTTKVLFDLSVFAFGEYYE